jgi:hypothetical protein
VSHRPKVDSERYLVLRREVLGANDPRSDVVDPYAGAFIFYFRMGD